MQTIDVPPPAPAPAPAPPPTEDASIQTDFVSVKHSEDPPQPPFTTLLQRVLRHLPLEPAPDDAAKNLDKCVYSLSLSHDMLRAVHGA